MRVEMFDIPPTPNAQEDTVTNLFRCNPEGKLDRKYLRVSATYRCLVRYGMTPAVALERLSDVMPVKDAKALLSVWAQTPKLRSVLRPQQTAA